VDELVEIDNGKFNINIISQNKNHSLGKLPKQTKHIIIIEAY